MPNKGLGAWKRPTHRHQWTRVESYDAYACDVPMCNTIITAIDWMNLRDTKWGQGLLDTKVPERLKLPEEA